MHRVSSRNKQALTIRGNLSWCSDQKPDPLIFLFIVHRGYVKSLVPFLSVMI
jgi:hypothetical protein